MVYYTFSFILIDTNSGDPGFHQWNLKLKDVIEMLRVSALISVSRLANTLQLFYYFRVIHTLTLLFLKIAIIIQIQRAFCSRQRNFTFWMCHVLLWAHVMLYVASIFVALFSCTPRAKAWDFILPGRCIDQFVADSTACGLNIASDILILILPQREIWKMNMSRRRKWGLSLLFGVGIL